MKRLPLILLASIALSLALPQTASGFGKNKVQYQHMGWEYLGAERYTLYFHQDMGELPEIAYVWLDDIYRDLSGRFRLTLPQPVPVVLYESPALFEQTNIITELLPEGVGGLTEVFKNRVALPFNGSYPELRAVLHHELVHAFVFGAIYGGGIFRMTGSSVPLWFNEGLAEVLSTGWNREADMFMLDRVLHSSVPPPGPALDGYMAYKGGQSFLYYLHSTGGDSLFNRMLIEFRNSRHAERAIEKVYGKSLEELGRGWISELRRIYWPEIGRRIEPSEHAKAVTVNTKDRSRFNLRPRLSPDGMSIAFFSDRKDFVRLIIADTSGKELRRIGQHSLSGSFESFQPFRGAIAWSPDSREIAFVAKRGGRNEIRFASAKTGRRSRAAIRPPLSAINGLDWSSDGNRVTFTAISHGRPDLYLYDLTTHELTLLMESLESKSSPRFSPDGKKIIFAVTDTIGLGTSELRSKPSAWPTSNIAVFDIETGIYNLLADTEWNDKQPAFSPDGSEFVFVSDRNGIDNLYIAPIDNMDDARPLTDYTGSAANPDWAADGSAIVYDLFMNQAWNVWRMTEPSAKILEDSALAPTRWAEHEMNPSTPFFKKRGPTADTAGSVNTDNTRNRAAPINAANDRHAVRARHAANTAVYIPPLDSIPTPHPYTLRFSPDMVIFGLGISTYSGASGQALASFSDIMGDHRITFIGDLQIDFSEYAQIFTTYQYLKRRVGITIGGFYYKYYAYGYDGDDSYIFHDTETGGLLGLSYPFSHFSRIDANVFGRYMERLPLTDDNTAVVKSNALLATLGYSFDNILWGITGPLNGFRGAVRLQAAPPLEFTEEAYLSADIDLRHYTHLFRRFVWANRVTAGGTIALGDDNRAARRFFLGGNENWFNYDVNGKNYYENLPYSFYSDIVSPLRGWNYFDVTGDRMLLMNSEFRFPFIREVTTVWPLPMHIRFINGAFFVDAGYAWTREEQEDQKSSLPIPPRLAGGYGFGMRANLGIFVLRYDRGWPMGEGRGGPINYFSLGAEF